MVERHQHAYALLSRPGVYNAVRRIFRVDMRPQFIHEFLQPKKGDRILDIGCGTGEILNHLRDVEYIGFDPNVAYIEWARRTFGDRGTFHVGRFAADSAASVEQVDIAMLVAVLHHMSDDESFELFRLLRSVVKPGGRVVTLDNVYIEKQNPIARLLISLDRGQNVRTPDEYAKLARKSFPNVQGVVVHKRFPPYTYWIMQAA